MNINEYSTISWDPVGSALYTVRLETPTGGVLHNIANIVGISLPATDLLLNAGAPRTGVSQGGSYKIRVQTQGAFGNSTGAVVDVIVQGAPDPANVIIS